jgi:hypothetical protein
MTIAGRVEVGGVCVVCAVIDADTGTALTMRPAIVIARRPKTAKSARRGTMTLQREGPARTFY